MAPRLNIRVGLTRVTKPQFASEPGYVAAVSKMVKVLKDDLEHILNQVQDATPEIVLEAMQPMFDKSQVYVPHRTGALKESGYLEITQTGAQPKVEMGYAKGGVPRYAALVHEQVEVPHQAPTRSKFLEAAVNEEMGATLNRIQEGYRRFMGV